MSRHFRQATSRGAAEFAEKDRVMELYRGEGRSLHWDDTQSPKALALWDNLTPSASPRLRVSYGALHT
ncbi:hypothetical protein Turpa_0849 [Turneriella parva DSM 21527]|uniref:Uncharacterized protein n=1 Tax=Turneriella parva (strain ATCC BAA-1111 / DSM 21527 / NCTC 11395 / H) TaxID=869212 RepID=I4B2J3_TURPD|nr:hypothetical protein Turpa_0849 [Turneriella parva DSM 21527]